MTRKLIHIALMILWIVWGLIWIQNAGAHFVPGRHNAEHAINKAWCGSNKRICKHGQEAKTVAKCEASNYWWWTRNEPTKAHNGQYLGMFQMGTYERRRFGHGPDPWSQARAAYRYWSVSNWYPWQCLPYGGLRW